MQSQLPPACDICQDQPKLPTRADLIFLLRGQFMLVKYSMCCDLTLPLSEEEIELILAD